MEKLYRTPLYDAHVALGAKIVPFAGWEMPVRYGSQIDEHHAVRNNVGIFDVSHMGELEVTGPEAEKLIQSLTCNDLSKLYPGRAQYNAILTQAGGVVDDIIVYKKADDKFFICVNASNAEKDFTWFLKHNTFNAEIKNRSDEFGLIAVQGPKAAELMSKLINPQAVLELKYFHFIDTEISSIPVTLARTGYTGEDGFEIFIPASETVKIWDALLSQDAVPCGLGARDTLRLEVCYPLHGHELSENTHAAESGLDWIIKQEKFKLLKPERALIGLFLDEPGIARDGAKVFAGEEEIGVVTSGTVTPTVNKALGLALVKTEYAKLNTQILIEVRGKKLAAHVTKKPFYQRKEN